MDPYGMQPPGGAGQPPQMPKPKKPPKPDPAARRMKPLDYVALLLNVDPPPNDAQLPPPVGYRYPEMPPDPYLPPPVAAMPPGTEPQPGLPNDYQAHVIRMRQKMGF